MRTASMCASPPCEHLLRSASIDSGATFGRQAIGTYAISEWLLLKGPFSVKIFAAACLLVRLSTTAANAIDLAELAPCKPAAARLCDRSGGMTWSMLQCGETLAAHSWRVGEGCRAVLRKYGKL